jgi:hypothetical protein
MPPTPHHLLETISSFKIKDTKKKKKKKDIAAFLSV